MTTFKFLLLLSLVASSFQENVQQQQQETALDDEESPTLGEQVSDSQSLQAPQTSQVSENELGQTSSEQVDEQPIPYSFAYDSGDESGNLLSRKESSDETGAVRGSYSYLDADGLFRTVEYIADKDGFRANIKTNEPGLNTKDASSPAGVTIQREQTPSAVLDRIANSRPKTLLPSVQQQTESPPTKSAVSRTVTTTTTRRPTVQTAAQTPSLASSSAGVLLLPDLQPVAQNELTLNPLLRMFQLVPVYHRDRQGLSQSNGQSSTLVMLLPESSSTSQQEQTDFSDGQASISGATSSTTTSTTVRPTSARFIKSFLRFGNRGSSSGASSLNNGIKSASSINQNTRNSGQSVKSIPTPGNFASGSNSLPIKGLEASSRSSASVAPPSAPAPALSTRQPSTKAASSNLLASFQSPARLLRKGTLKSS